MSIIRTQTSDGELLLNPDHIVSVVEASPNAQWHGTKSIIRTVDGKVWEVQSTVQALCLMIDAERG